MSSAELFDYYANGYDQALTQALSSSGEKREYFAEGRVSWLTRCLSELGEVPSTVLDYGCGDGSTTPLLLAASKAKYAVGVDVSEKSIENARSLYSNPQLTYEPVRDFQPSGEMDLAYCNGVFHHIPLIERAGAVAFVNSALKLGGLFAFWENNPWNPATRYVMSRCAFDGDAITLTPPEARALLCAGGFEILRTDFRFIFPRYLRFLRKLEGAVYRLPFGAQYQLLCRKIR